MIVVCCYCRRECGPADHRGFRFAVGPVLSEREQDRASHGICVRCFEKEFGQLDERGEAVAKCWM